MKIYYLFLILSTSAIFAMSQIKPVEKCQICGKPKSLCQGHPKAKCKICGKPLDKCTGHRPKHEKPGVQEPVAYEVTFSCNVTTANMFIDGGDYGTPNGTKNLKAGKHSVRLMADGYLDYATTIEVKKENTSFDFDLEPFLYNVTISTNVSNAVAFIDGNLQDSLSFMLPKGRYDLKLTAKGFEDYLTEIIVDENHTSFDFNLSKSLLSFQINGVEFTMVYVQGGTFFMGATSEQGEDACDNEKPVHQVQLSSYYIAQTEITEELYEAILGPCHRGYQGSRLPIMASYEKWEELINKLNELTGLKFRMPTEAEWEYAARGGIKSKGFKFSGSNNLDDVAWYEYNSDKRYHPVAQKEPNELGLFDMSGNIDEWCIDCYKKYDNDKMANPIISGLEAAQSQWHPNAYITHVVRGGNYVSDSSFCRVSYRDKDVEKYVGDLANGAPGFPPPENGLRLAL